MATPEERRKALKGAMARRVKASSLKFGDDSRAIPKSKGIRRLNMGAEGPGGLTQHERNRLSKTKKRGSARQKLEKNLRKTTYWERQAKKGNPAATPAKVSKSKPKSFGNDIKITRPPGWETPPGGSKMGPGLRGRGGKRKNPGPGSPFTGSGRKPGSIPRYPGNDPRGKFHSLPVGNPTPNPLGQAAARRLRRR